MNRNNNKNTNNSEEKPRTHRELGRCWPSRLVRLGSDRVPGSNPFSERFFAPAGDCLLNGPLARDLDAVMSVNQSSMQSSPLPSRHQCPKLSWMDTVDRSGYPGLPQGASPKRARAGPETEKCAKSARAEAHSPVRQADAPLCGRRKRVPPPSLCLRRPSEEHEGLPQPVEDRQDSLEQDEYEAPSCGREKRILHYSKPVEIVQYLHLGDASHAADRATLEECNIKYVLNVTPDVPNHFETPPDEDDSPSRIKYLRISVFDNQDERNGLSRYFKDASAFISKCTESFGPSCVDCSNCCTSSLLFFFFLFFFFWLLFIIENFRKFIGLANDDVTKHSNVWQRAKLVLNKGSVPYKSMPGGKSLTGRSSLFLRREVWKVLTTLSQLSASHIKRYRGSDKCEAVFQSIDWTNFAGCYVGCCAVT